MRLTMTVPEAVTLAGAAGALPPFVRDVRAEDDVVRVDVDPTSVPGVSGLARLGAALAGTVAVTVRLVRFADGVATLGLGVRARGLPLDALVRALAGHVTAMARRRDLDVPIAVRQEASGPVVDLGVQAALDGRVRGIAITCLTLRDGTVQVDATVADEVVLP